MHIVYTCLVLVRAQYSLYSNPLQLTVYKAGQSARLPLTLLFSYYHIDCRQVPSHVYQINTFANNISYYHVDCRLSLRVFCDLRLGSSLLRSLSIQCNVPEGADCTLVSRRVNYRNLTFDR